PAVTPPPAQPAESAPAQNQKMSRRRAEAPRPSPRPQEVELPLGKCRSLYERKQYQEAINTAEAALERARGEASASGPRAHEVAELWSLLALSRQALGDDEGARSAFEEALHTAPEADRQTYQRQ